MKKEKNAKKSDNVRLGGVFELVEKVNRHAQAKGSLLETLML